MDGLDNGTWTAEVLSYLGSALGAQAPVVKKTEGMYVLLFVCLLFLLEEPFGLVLACR
jgi:hypothetical protein